MTEKSGSIRIPRSRFEAESTWLKSQPASPDEAWIDIVQLAAQKPYKTKVGKSFTEIERGQVLVSIRSLAGRWHWSAGRVVRWLESQLGCSHLRVRSVTTEGNIYVVENYDSYDCDEYAPTAHDEYAPEYSSPGGGDIVGEDVKASSLVVLRFPCVPGKAKDPSVWPLTQPLVDKWQSVFVGVDVLAQAKRALLWLESKKKLKTYRGMPGFMTTWLGNAQDRSGPGTGPAVRQEALRTPDDLAFAAKVYARYAWSWTDVYERLSLVPPPAPSRESCIEPILRARDLLAQNCPDAEQRVWEAMCEANKDRFLRGANPKFPTPSFSIEKILEISQHRNKPVELSNAYRAKPLETRDIHPDDIEDEVADRRSLIVLEAMQSELSFSPKGIDGPSH